ncbi:pyridoxal phosphate-dependent aminotransferase [Massilia consociata]|uniref:Pyridoxal phosphate-dependent aminotransferase n=1 Tax=Massilia consociata TaxID=760117 RepID=A0ABV6FAC1_9BURK
MKLSDRINRSRPLATTAMHGRADALREAGEPVIDFSIAISHFPAPAAVREAIAHEAGRECILPYTDVGGAVDVRASLCAKLRAENGIEATPDEVVVTNGAKQALYEALFALTDPGDTVIVFRPHWPAYVTTAQLLGLRIVLADLPDSLTPEALDALGPARVLIVNNPHNPTGKVYTLEELGHLRDWAQRSSGHIVVDESYEHLIFNGNHTSLASLCDWRKLGVVTIFSASQSYAMMGWRVGFALAPRPLARAMHTLQGPITAAAPWLSQVAARAAFAGGRPGGMLEDYHARRDLVLDMLAPVPWITMAPPDSGPYLWGDIRALTSDTLGFAESLLEEEGVALMPGDALGVPGFIRIGYISDDIVTLREGVRRIVAYGEYLRAAARA